MPLRTTHPHTGVTITAQLSETAWVISPHYGESYSFDRAGRLLSLFVDGRSYQRTLDGRLLERVNRPGERRRPLPEAETAALLAHVFATMGELAGLAPYLELAPADRDVLAEALATILAFGPEALAADAAAFHALYLPVSILPPDQYLAVVLQATEGCSWNRCTFCDLYRDRSFRIKRPDAFREHCAAVRAYFGAGLSLRRGLFLADANALIIPFPRLRALLEIAQEHFTLPEGPRPVYSFVSAFHVGLKSAAEWAELAARGLTRAYIGLETGDDALLRFLNKPGTVADAVEAGHALRAGGVSVGVILMAGIGGERFAEAHVDGSVEALAAMALGPGDQVYISDYVAVPGSQYEYEAMVAGIRPLSEEEIAAQRTELQARARAVAPGVPVAPYHVDGFAV